MAVTNMFLNILHSPIQIFDHYTEIIHVRVITVTHYFLKTLDCSQRCIHHQLRQIVHKSLGFRPN